MKQEPSEVPRERYGRKSPLSARRGRQEPPKSVRFAAGLPETVGSKVLKYRLRAEHAGHYGDPDA